ncbi:DUF6923 family protein [Actinokineospora enzanensis]|uniref:DUF6923 family protein n=1 Tax=Actinokineospora enzanensis TaxID=155975 RepID=UPI000477077E|nr:hypothetical protein [Actinokineospora enzanensis]
MSPGRKHRRTAAALDKRVVLAAAGVACVVGAAGVVLRGAEGEAAQPRGTDCVFYRVHSPDSGLSVLSKVDLADDTVTRVATLGYRVNAIGYSVPLNTLWGLATRDAHGSFTNGAHVVAISGNGSVVDYGQVHSNNDLVFPHDRFMSVTAGTMVGNTLVIREAATLYRIDLNPSSPDYMALVGSTPMWPGGLASDVDDFDVRAGDGLAYGVSAADHEHARVVRIDLTSGQVSRVDAPALPGSSSYGMVVMGPDDALYAGANRVEGAARLYRVGLDPNAHVDPIATWAAVSSADATSCLPGIAPATTAPPSPPQQQPVPPPAARTTTPPPPRVTSTVISPTPIPVVPPPPPAVPPAVPPPVPAPPVPAARATFRKPPPTVAAPHVNSAHHSTQEKRRWGVTMLVIIIGAGAAAAAGRRRR